MLLTVVFTAVIQMFAVDCVVFTAVSQMFVFVVECVVFIAVSQMFAVDCCLHSCEPDVCC